MSDYDSLGVPNGLNLYKTLDVSPNDPVCVIKKAYRAKALIHHPDKNPDDRERAEEMFKKIVVAWEVLGDEKKRKIYDTANDQCKGGGRSGNGRGREGGKGRAHGRKGGNRRGREGGKGRAHGRKGGKGRENHGKYQKREFSWTPIKPGDYILPNTLFIDGQPCNRKLDGDDEDKVFTISDLLPDNISVDRRRFLANVIQEYRVKDTRTGESVKVLVHNCTQKSSFLAFCYPISNLDQILEKCGLPHCEILTQQIEADTAATVTMVADQLAAEREKAAAETEAKAAAEAEAKAAAEAEAKAAAEAEAKAAAAEAEAKAAAEAEAKAAAAEAKAAAAAASKVAAQVAAQAATHAEESAYLAQEARARAACDAVVRALAVAENRFGITFQGDWARSSSDEESSDEESSDEDAG